MDQEETAMQMNKAKPNVAAADSKESPVWTVLWSIPFPFWVMMAEWGKSWERASLYYLLVVRVVNDTDENSSSAAAQEQTKKCVGRWIMIKTSIQCRRFPSSYNGCCCHLPITKHVPSSTSFLFQGAGREKKKSISRKWKHNILIWSLSLLLCGPFKTSV